MLKLNLAGTGDAIYINPLMVEQVGPRQRFDHDNREWVLVPNETHIKFSSHNEIDVVGEPGSVQSQVDKAQTYFVKELD